MTYRLFYAPTFRDDISKQIEYWRAQHVADTTIDSWFAKLFGVVQNLESMPRMFPVDPFYSEAAGTETHKIILGDHLVFFLSGRL